MQRVASRVQVACAAVLVMGVFGASPVLAQNRQEGLGVQIVGGPLFANLTDAEGLDTSNKTGFLVGLALGGNRGGTVGVEADVLYGQKGAKIAGFDDFTQNVVHVPIMLKLNFGSKSANGLNVFALGGGFFDWQFNGKLGDLDISNDTNGYEIGYVVGAGIEALRFSVQGRYIRGVREIDKTFSVGSSTESKSQSFAILVGLRIH